MDAVSALDPNLLDLKMIGVKKVTGGTMRDSFLVDGVAFKKTFSYAGFEQQPKHFSNPKVPSRFKLLKTGSRIGGRWGCGNSQSSATSGPKQELRSQNVGLIGCQSVRQWSSFLFAADSCPCVEKLRTVSPLTVGIRDGVVQLVSTLGSVVISARAALGSIIASALPVATLLTRQRVCAWVELGGLGAGSGAEH